MIIYGTKGAVVAGIDLTDKCLNCASTHSIQMTVFQKYAHVFWIPVFPVGKTGATTCAHCKQVLLKEEFTDSLRSSYEHAKANSKTPFWTFSGLALLSILIMVGSINSKQKDKRNAAWIGEPQKGDIYEIKLGYKHYTLYKVDDIAGDTVYVLPNEYETNKVRGLAALKDKGAEAFIPEPFPLLKAELKEKLKTGEIIDVERK